jgi:purine-nucleoside phosphorylase
MEKSVEFIKSKIGSFVPEIGIILGSGLGSLADDYCDMAINYNEIPNFEASTISGHKGRLVFAEIGGKKVVMMQGRFHFYEGHSMQKVVYPIKVMAKLGVKKLIVTNAAGGINKEFSPSDLMLIKDHINLMGTNPLIGKNDDTLGTRFPDMSEVYNKELRDVAKSCAKDLEINLQEGVYVATTGPSYETPTEVKMLKTMGADAVGMSTVPEAIVANYCGLKVLGISCISNYASGVSEQKLAHEEVIEATRVVGDKFKFLVLSVIKKL